MGDQIKVGLVGARRGTAFASGFRAIPGVDVTAICDTNEEFLKRRADEFDIPNRFIDFSRLLESDVNLVVVATPMDLHVPQSLAALNAGKHVMSEVTAAVSMQQCKNLVKGVQAARRQGLKYMMAENSCYLRSNVLIKNMVREGLFGETYYAEGAYIHDIKSLHYHADGTPTWRSKWQVGVNGCTYGSHSLGPVLDWFNDRVETVACLGSGRHTAPEHEAEDTTTMLCKTRSGALINIRVDMLSNRPHCGSYYALQGTKGCYEASRGMGDEPKIWLDRFGIGSVSRETIDTSPYQWRPLSELEDEFLPDYWRTPPPEALRAGHGGTDYYVTRGIIDAIRENREPQIDVYRALDYTVPGLLSQESIAKGGIPIKVPDFRSGVWA